MNAPAPAFFSRANRARNCIAAFLLAPVLALAGEVVHDTAVRFASHVMSRSVHGPAADYASHLRVRPAQTMPRLSRPWLRLLLEQDEDDRPAPNRAPSAPI